MDADKFRDLIREGETVEVEFKQSLQSSHEIARILCAFANTQGGLLFLGIGNGGEVKGLEGNLDMLQQKISQSNTMVHPSPLINIEILTLEGKKIIVVTAHKAGASVFHTVEGVIFVRIGSTIQKLEGQSIVEFLRHRQILQFDESIEPTAQLADLDVKKIEAYLEKRGQAEHLKTHALKDFLLSKNIATLQPDFTLKSTALLFFAKEPQQFYPHTKIKLVRFDGTTPVKTIAYEDAKGAPPELIDHSANFVMRFVPKEFVIESLKRTEIPLLPREAVRESVINAVAHRDYFNKNEIQVSVFDDRVEITNPGGLPEGMTKELLGALSIQRNPRIYQFLSDYGYMEGIGSGISKIYELMDLSHLGPPEFLLSKEFFRITLRMEKRKGRKTAQGMDVRHENALGYLKEHSKLKSSEYATMNKISLPTALKELHTLEKKGAIKKVGKTRGSYYTLKDA